MSNSKATVLLGTHFSGKSTFFKHIKFLRLNQNIEDKESLSNLIKDNCKHKIEGFLLFIKEKGNELNLTTDIEDTINHIIEKQDYAQKLFELINKSEFQKIYKQLPNYYLDNNKYFLDNASRILDKSFIAEYSDFLGNNEMTSGVSELQIEDSGMNLTLFDVGGRRQYRRSWITCFMDLDCVLFFVNLTEYAQTLYEDNEVNRMRESLTLFENVSSNNFLQSATLILVLTHYDTFEELLSIYPLSKTFDDYIESNEKDCALNFIQDKFKATAKKDITIVTTNLLDRQGALKVFDLMKSKFN
ncbi:guanine nucleotide-binding protein g(o) subunit alpha [Anaeramoeba flamelloides]|uniref:Guanine nucleotide-binding protein g(O) subunit alpha n=1 Tax=Anaeramoeba flamelloides TaxID=1746091 RepID=A0ABQ8XC82_9EUKA|nr:guanine nucleotide-binding protein g(o) subunit alpha [Anaeramoeba flamelloides]